jgi:hypothetical protein
LWNTTVSGADTNGVVGKNNGFVSRHNGVVGKNNGFVVCYNPFCCVPQPLCCVPQQTELSLRKRVIFYHIWFFLDVAVQCLYGNGGIVQIPDGA